MADPDAQNWGNRPPHLVAVAGVVFQDWPHGGEPPSPRALPGQVGPHSSPHTPARLVTAPERQMVNSDWAWAALGARPSPALEPALLPVAPTSPLAASSQLLICSGFRSLPFSSFSGKCSCPEYHSVHFIYHFMHVSVC